MAKKSDEVESSGLKMIISEGASNSISVIRRSSIPTPNTLALLEDPRSWHVRGEVGIQRKRHRRDDSNTEAMVAYPMAPPPPRDRAIPSRKVVLEEEEYVERLGDIIEGDYFPHNAKMSRALTRMAQNGATGVREGVTTPSGRSVIGTPSTLGSTTPASISFGDGSGAGASGVSIARGKGKGTPGTGGALTKFVATHTSEDNEAFAELQEKDQEAFRKRYFWAYEPANGEGASSAIPIKLLMMPNGKMMSAERRAEMDAACADRPKIGDHRPNQVETWKHRTRNQLMFSPNIAKSNDTCKIQEPLPLMIEEAEKRSSSNSKRRLISASEYYGKRQGKTKMTLLSEGEKPVSPGGGQGGVESGGEDLDTAASADSDSSTLKPDADADDDMRKSQEDALEESSLEGEERRDEVEREGIDKSEKEESTRSRHNGSPFESQSGCRSRRAASVVVKSNPKIIQAHATRFPMLPPPAPRPTGKWSSPIESPSSSRESVAELLAGGAKDKDSSGDYSEVPMTPSRVPGVDGDSPQITWGSIDGTPMILDPRATPLPDGSGIGAFDVRSFISGGGPRFEIKDLPEREKLAHRLEADDTRRKRAKLGITGAAAKATPTPSSTPCTPRTPGAGRTPGSTERPRSTRSRQSSASLNPAARTLALKLARKRSNATPFGGGLTPGRQTRRRENKRGTSGELATPTPNTPSSIVGKAGSGTPRVGGKGGSSSGGSEKKSSSLTDGLLAVK